MTKIIIGHLSLVITEHCVLLAVSHRRIICLSLSPSKNNWSGPHSKSCNCSFKDNLISHQNGKLNFNGTHIQAQFCALLWSLYSTTSYKNTQLFHDSLMMTSKIDKIDYLCLCSYEITWICLVQLCFSITRGLCFLHLKAFLSPILNTHVSLAMYSWFSPAMWSKLKIVII